MWYDDQCKLLRNGLHRASKHLAKNKFDRDAQNKFFGAKKKYISYCKKCEKTARNSLTKQQLATERNSPTSFWSLVKKMRTWGKKSSSHTDSIEPNEWLFHFFKLFNTTGSSEVLSLPRDAIPYFSELDILITESEIAAAFNKLNKESKANKKYLTLFG